MNQLNYYHISKYQWAIKIDGSQIDTLFVDCSDNFWCKNNYLVIQVVYLIQDHDQIIADSNSSLNFSMKKVIKTI